MLLFACMLSVAKGFAIGEHQHHEVSETFAVNDIYYQVHHFWVTNDSWIGAPERQLLSSPNKGVGWIGGGGNTSSESWWAEVVRGPYDHTLTHLVIPATVEYEGKICNVITIDSEAFMNNPWLYSVTAPHICNIKSSAFMGCTGLVTVKLKDEINYIGAHAFQDCPQLATVESVITTSSAKQSSPASRQQNVPARTLSFGTTVGEIDEYAFAGCTKLTDGLVNVKDFRYIHQYAFKDCKGLSTVRIPNLDVNDYSDGIEAYAYAGCSGIKDVYTEYEKAIDENVFDATTYQNATLHVPSGKIGTYKVLEGWKNFARITDGTSVEELEEGDTFTGKTAEGVEMEFTVKDATSKTCYVGRGDHKNSVNKSTSGKITIPSTINGYQVVGISRGGFEECANITEVSVPEGVTVLDGMSFAYCTALKKVSLPSTLKSMHGMEFAYCSSLTDIVLPESLEETEGNGDFVYCNSLKSITIPSKLTRVPSFEFFECPNLETVNLPNSVTTIEERAFSGCSSLQSITIPSGVDALPDYVFERCSSLQSISVPNSVTSIGYGAMALCDKLETVELPAGLKTLGDFALYNCPSLKQIALPNNLVNIGTGAFANCTSLQRISIPSGVIKIVEDVFWGCTSLTSASLPSSLKEVGAEAFAHCVSLQSIDIPSGVETIGRLAFEVCTNLSSVSLPSALKVVEDGAFIMSGLKQVFLPSTLETIGTQAFAGCVNLAELSIPANVSSIGYSIVGKCRNLKTLTVAAGNRYFRSSGNAIINRTTNKLVQACPATVIPTDIVGIEEQGFAMTDGLEEIVIPENIKTIGLGAFEDCKDLKRVTIPAGIQVINDEAFLECVSLEQVTVLSPAPVAISDNVFHMTETWNEDYTESTTSDFTTATLYVPHGCKAAYQAAEGWKNFQNIVEMEREEPKLVLTKLAVEGDCIIGTAHKASFSVRNDGAAFDGNVYLLVKAESEDEWAYWTWECQIASGEEVSMQADNFAFDSPDTYRFWVATETSDMEGLGSQTIVVTSAATLTARNYTREYGEENPEFGFTADKGGFSGEPVITCEATKESPVGTYPIVIAQGSVDNEFVTYVNGTLTITKAPLTARAKSYTCKQGEEIPALGVEYSGWKLSETENVLTRKPTATTSATAQSAPGTYAIIVSGGEARNYDFNYVNGTLTITEADAILVTAKSYTRAYGEENPVLEYTVEGGTLMGEPTITCETTKLSPVGTYEIVLGKGSVTNPNVTFVNGTLTIEKAYQTLTWEQNLLDIEQYTQAELTAEATSGLPVEYHVTDESVCTVNTIGSKHFLDCFGLGETVIYAVQNGDSNWWQTTKTYKTVRIVNTSGIDTLADGEREFDVYSVNGQMVRKSARNLQSLPKGVYIVKGKRVVVK